MLRPPPPAPHALRPDTVLAIGESAAEALPRESCGVAWRDRFERFGLSALTADSFRLRARDALRLERLLRGDDPPLVLWHAHTRPGHADGLSAEDRRGAAPGGEPLHPSLAWLVVDVRRGRYAGATLHAWRDGAFSEIARFRP